MNIQNTPKKYGAVTKFFHWSIMLLFLFQFLSIIYFRYLEDNGGDFTWRVMHWHKTSGLLILILGTLRYIWRLTTPLPDWPKNFTDWDTKISHFAEWGLYASIFVMTLSGTFIELIGGYYINFFGIFHLDAVSPFVHAGDASYDENIVKARKAVSSPFVHDLLVAVHVVGAYAVIVFLTVHLTHVFRHQVMLKDKLLNRMLPGDDVSEDESTPQPSSDDNHQSQH